MSEQVAKLKWKLTTPNMVSEGSASNITPVQWGEVMRVLHNVPLDIVLFCPKCQVQHIDEPMGEWTNPPHRSHLCNSCKHVWRLADVPTNGVERVETCGKRDSKIIKPCCYDCENSICDECDRRPT